MFEFRRVFSKKILFFLIALSAISVFYLTFDFPYSNDFGEEYSAQIEALQKLKPDEAYLELESKEAALKEYMAALLWKEEENPETKAVYAKTCVSLMGENFEEKISAFDFSTEGKDRFYSKQQVLTEIKGQLEYLKEYPAYLDSVHENAEQISALSIFNRGTAGKFNTNNLKKTDRDFPKSDDIEIGLTKSAAFSRYIQDKFSSICVIVFLMAVIVKLIEEKKNGMSYLAYGSFAGRKELTVKRILILLCASCVGVIFIKGATFSAYAVMYGGIGNFDMPVQSIEIFKTYTHRHTAGAFFLIFTLLQLIGFWLTELLIYIIASLSENLKSAVLAVFAFLSAEFMMFLFIPDSFALVILRFINVFAFVDIERVMLKYLNINFFTAPISGAKLTFAFIPLLAVISIVVLIHISEKNKPIKSPGLITVFSGRLRAFTSKHACAGSKLGFELRKILIHQRGAVGIILIIAWFTCFAPSPPADTKMFNTETAYYQAEFHGIPSDKTVKAIERQIEEAEGWTDGEVKQNTLAALSSVKAEAEEKMSAASGLWIVNPVPTACLMNGETAYQRKNALIVLLSIILTVCGIFSYERENNMEALIKTSKEGIRASDNRKLLLVFLFSFLLWGISSLSEILKFTSEYGAIFDLSAPIQSMEYFNAFPLNMNMRMVLVAYYLLKLIPIITAGTITASVSRISKSVNGALLLSCAIILLPALIGAAGAEFFDKLSLSRMMSPVESSIYVYFAAVCVSICGIVYIKRRVRAGENM